MLSCPICGDNPLHGRWTDYSGEMNCMKCGIPLQVKWGTDEQKAEKAYPYVNMYPCLAEHLGEYHRTTGKRARFGRWMGQISLEVGAEQHTFWEWMEKHHPKWGPPQSSTGTANLEVKK